jgi:WD40 repeat protein
VERHVAAVWLLDVAAGRIGRSFAGHSDWVLWVAFGPDGMTLASGSYAEVILWDLRSGTPVRTIRKTDWSMVAFALSPDGGLLASGGWTFPPGEDGRPYYRTAVGGLQLWSAGSGELLRTVQAHDGGVTSVCAQGHPDLGR